MPCILVSQELKTSCYSQFRLSPITSALALECFPIATWLSKVAATIQKKKKNRGSHCCEPQGQPSPSHSKDHLSLKVNGEGKQLGCIQRTVCGKGQVSGRFRVAQRFAGRRLATQKDWKWALDAMDLTSRQPNDRQGVPPPHHQNLKSALASGSHQVRVPHGALCILIPLQPHHHKIFAWRHHSRGSTRLADVHQCQAQPRKCAVLHWSTFKQEL